MCILFVGWIVIVGFNIFFCCKVYIISTLTLILWSASHPSSSWTVNKIYLIFSNGLIIYVLCHYGNINIIAVVLDRTPCILIFFHLSTIKNMSIFHITTRSTWFQLLFCVNKLLFEDWKFPAEMVNKLKCSSKKQTLCSHFKLVKISFTSGRAACRERERKMMKTWLMNGVDLMSKNPWLNQWCDARWIDGLLLVICLLISFFCACLSSLNLANS